MMRNRSLFLLLLLFVLPTCESLAQVGFEKTLLGGTMSSNPRRIIPLNSDADDETEFIAAIDEQILFLDKQEEIYIESYISDARFQSMTVEDMNGDGLDDIIATSFDYSHDTSLVIFESNGDGSFLFLPLDLDNYLPVGVGDLDGDHDIDFVGIFYHDFAWLENTGNYDFVTHIIENDVSYDTQATLVEDFDNDGDADILSYCGSGDDIVLFLLNDGNQNFTISEYNVSELEEIDFPMKMCPWRDPVTNLWTVVLTDYSGLIPLELTQTVDNTWSINELDLLYQIGMGDIGDVDGDGHYDIVANAFGWFNQQGDGTFQHYMLPEQGATALVYDWDHDGMLDLLGRSEGQFTLFRNLGSASPLASFGLISPANDEIVSQPMIFSWYSSGTVEEWDSLAYDLLISRESDFSPLDYRISIHDTTYSDSLPYDETIYFWKVEAKSLVSMQELSSNQTGSFQTSDLGSFNLLTPDPSTPFYPDNVESVEFSWETSDLDGDSSSISYTLYILPENENLENAFSVAPMETTHYTLNLLDVYGEDLFNRLFYWWVIAENGVRTTHSRETWMFEVWSTTAPEVGENHQPEKFCILSTSPNPFNPTTTIRLELPNSGNLTVDVFDILGQRVALLHQGQEKAGIQSYVLNGSNLSSGMYLIRASLDGYNTQFSKAIFLK